MIITLCHMVKLSKPVKFAVISNTPPLFFVQFIYVNQSFAPSPDQEVGVLFEVSIIDSLDMANACFCAYMVWNKLKLKHCF